MTGIRRNRQHKKCGPAGTKATRSKAVFTGRFDRCARGVFAAAAILCCLALPAGDVLAAEGYDQVAKGAALSSAEEDLGSYGMTPIAGSFVEDGEYPVETACSSSFFKAEKTILTVKDGEMTATLTMSSSSYLFVYPGTAGEAASADYDEYIPAEKIDGWSTFTIPVPALNAPFDLAAYSKRKEKWYPRRFMILAGSIPADKLSFAYPDYDRIDEAIDLYDEANGTDSREELRRKTAESAAAEGADGAVNGGDATNDGSVANGENAVNGESATDPAVDGPVPVGMEEADGSYSIDVDLVGGSGRASVTSPTWLYIRDGKAYARLLWSSTYYDYMILGGKTYLNETTDGGPSSFTIPITALDEPVPITADTTAMGDPLEIGYTLTFYSDTVGDVSRIPQEAAKTVLIIALIVMVAGGIINYFVKRKRL